MKKIQIEKIKVGENIRKDYGDLTELSASIRIHGVRNPVELNSKNELIDGFRRVKAAKAAGIKEIPYFINEDELDKTSSQLISGIFQKNLNPIEEGKAFKNFMDHKHTPIEDFAKKISKKVSYIEKRLELINTSSEVQKALIQGKIAIGHALLLARFTKENSKDFLKKIIRETMSVEEAKESLEYSSFTARLKDAKFCKNDCKDCKYNGSKQAELFETGTILNGTCMNPKCFKDKVKEFVKQKKEEFKDILYVGEKYSTPKGYVEGSSSWECENKKITDKYKARCRDIKENYLVGVFEDGEIKEYFKIPQNKTEKINPGCESEILLEKREDVLKSRVNEFKNKFLVSKTIELMTPGTKETKALSLLKILQSSDWNERDVVSKELGNVIKKEYGASVNVKKIFEAKEDELDNALALMSRNALRKVDLKELVLISREFKVDIKKHFVITEEFLKMHTISQLDSLIVELGLNIPKEELKKVDLVKFILKQNLKGKVPKIVL